MEDLDEKGMFKALRDRRKGLDNLITWWKD